MVPTLAKSSSKRRSSFAAQQALATGASQLGVSVSGSLLASTFCGFGEAGRRWLAQLKPDPLGGPRGAMATRTASCSCGQLRIRVEGEPRGVGICHCLAWQQRTGSAFAALARFSTPFSVSGTATEYVRVCDQGTRFRYRFCPTCGTTVFHAEDGDDGYVDVAVGAFADQAFPAPQESIYDSRRHPWVALPPGTTVFDKDPP